MNNPDLRPLVKSLHGIDSEDAVSELIYRALGDVRAKLSEAQEILAVLGLWAVTRPRNDPARKRLADVSDLLTDVAKAIKDTLALSNSNSTIPF